MAEPGEDLRDFECSESFPLSIVPRALAISFLIFVFFLLRYSAGASAEKRVDTVLLQCL